MDGKDGKKRGWIRIESIHVVWYFPFVVCETIKKCLCHQKINSKQEISRTHPTLIV